MGAMLCSYGLSIFIICLYALYCWNENGRRDRIDAAGGERVHMDTDFKDLTDKQVSGMFLIRSCSLTDSCRIYTLDTSGEISENTYIHNLYLEGYFGVSRFEFALY